MRKSISIVLLFIFSFAGFSSAVHHMEDSTEECNEDSTHICNTDIHDSCALCDTIVSFSTLVLPIDFSNPAFQKGLFYSENTRNKLGSFNLELNDRGPPLFR